MNPDLAAQPTLLPTHHASRSSARPGARYRPADLRFSGRTFPQVAQIVQALSAVGGRWWSPSERARLRRPSSRSGELCLCAVSQSREHGFM
jgi:hypothetical protein